jgi:molybdopterin converting factor small subunit
MEIRVRYYASLVDHISDMCAESLVLPEGTTIARLKLALGERHPQLIPLLQIALTLVNKRYVFRCDQPLRDGDEVDLLPPICGG